jgi:L-asparaginase II
VMERLGADLAEHAGAEGVFCAALPEVGLGVAIKVDDGNNARAAEVAMAAVIESFVALDDSEAAFLRSLSDVTLRNWNGIEVGRLVAAQALRTLR